MSGLDYFKSESLILLFNKTMGNKMPDAEHLPPPELLVVKYLEAAAQVL